MALETTVTQHWREQVILQIAKETQVKSEVIFLHSPDAESHNDPNSWVNTFQNEYCTLLWMVIDNVQIYDPRLDPRLDYSDPNSRKYRSEDDSHPSTVNELLSCAEHYKLCSVF